ncbi:TrbG/VirB9 family P-type conjugative transfer protein [Polaromonas aquatica]|uniref:TrbG/VirB9 family P-type conjugative transfer protein n=1 Tax=Polaromonas aquatica TaxID=332657 RepID=A0ABW1TVA4_9BURK
MNFRQMALVTALSLIGLVGQSHAELIATPLTGDTRLVQFTYDEDNTFLVLAKPKAVTHLQFAADEMLQSVASGDTAQWELTPTKNRKNLFIKPKFEGIETSMTVITDKRTYQFVLRSTADGKKWYQRVSWMYSSSLVLEQDALLDAQPNAPVSGGLPDLAANNGIRPSQTAFNLPRVTASVSSPTTLKPDSLRFNYKIEGDAAFKPTQVFDDGKFTYLKMPQDVQEMPALFSVIEGQEYSLVNYTVDGSYMVAQRLLENAVLKLGKSEVMVTKVKSGGGFMGFLRGDGAQ